MAARRARAAGGDAGDRVSQRSVGRYLRARWSAFHKGLNETGYVEGQNVTVEYLWLAGQYDRLPAFLADLVRRQVAVIAVPGSTPAALAAKAATAKIPIVFGVGEDPVRLGLVANLARPGGNATGINFFVAEVVAKRLRLLHDIVPKAVRVAVLVNPANASITETTLNIVQEAARAIGLQTEIINARTISEIDAVFASFARERPMPSSSLQTGFSSAVPCNLPP
jgi:putative ABC transport system substrate-binding protein